MKKISNPRWMKVIEEYIWSENIPLTVLSERTGVPYDTVVRWFRDYEFQKTLEKRYYDAQTVDWLKAVKKMLKEAQKGDVSAFNAVKPIVEKNIARINAGQQSPHDFFIQINQIGTDSVEIENAEIVQDPFKELQEVHTVPSREVEKKTYKQKVNKSKRNALMKLKRRAAKVGLVSLSNGRPSKTEKAKWLKKLEKLENRGIKPPSP